MKQSFLTFAFLITITNSLSHTSDTHHYNDDALFHSQQNFTRYPVILVPGDGGNQLWSKLNKTNAPHYFCQLKSKDYFLLWLNLEEVPPYSIDCFIDNIRLVYDNKTKRNYDSPGVDVKIKDFGQTQSVEYLDDDRLSVTSYFGPIVNNLVKKFNYKRGLNIMGAPYDWRKAPDELDEFYQNFTKLIEDTYYVNNGTPVMIIAHSMGNPVTLYFLNNYVTQQWKDKYIRIFVSLSGVWGGAVKTLRLMAAGDNVDIIVVKPIKVRGYQRTAPSTAFLMPNDKFWGPDELLAARPSRNYTVNDYEQFFSDIGYNLGYTLRKNTEKLIYDLNPPNVESVFYYGVQVQTPTTFVWKNEKDFPDTQPGVIYGDGDGTVNLRSLLGYKRWIGKQSQPISFQEFPGSEHVATLKNQAVIDAILKLFYI